MNGNPRNMPGSASKKDPKLGQKEAKEEKSELDEDEDQKDPNLGQKEAEDEKSELDEDEDQDDELEPMTDRPPRE